MPVEVEGPDGTIYEFPDGTPQAIMRSAMNKVYGAPKAEKKPPPGRGKGGFREKLDAATRGLGDVLSTGFADEATAAVYAPLGATIDAVKGRGFNLGKAYNRQLGRERATDRYDEENNAGTRLAGQLVGGAMIPFGSGAKTATQIAKVSGLSGAAYGLGSGEDVQDRLEKAVTGGAAGAAAGYVVGKALPVVTRMVERPIRGAIRMQTPNSGISREIVARSLADDNVTAREAGELLDAARERGTPAMLADLGDNVRGLAGAVSRQPGASRRIMRDAVIERQLGQGERIRGAITRDLGDIVDPIQASDDLIAQAQARAAPIYDEAYAAPARNSEELASILGTPAGKAALGRARTIAANERRNPLTMGFDLDDQGEVILTQDPSVQTLDYVKRGLDDLLEPYRNAITGKLQLDESGRAINQVRAQLVGEIDRLNPVYAQARAAYAGPARERDALELGRKALRMSPEEITRATNRLSEGERAQFALGFRTELSNIIDSRVDGGDKVQALIGTPKKREALRRAFSDQADLDNFMMTLGDERRAADTYRAINTGSPTAGRLADDALIDDPSLLEDAAGRAIRGARGGTAGMIAEGIQVVRDAGRFGVGEAGKRTREEIAALLAETDPALLREALRQAIRDRATQRARDKGVKVAVDTVSTAVGKGAGITAASASGARQDRRADRLGDQVELSYGR